LLHNAANATSDYVRKTFQFITVCMGDKNHRKPKTAKIIEFGAVSPRVKFLLPLQGEPF